MASGFWRPFGLTGWREIKRNAGWLRASRRIDDADPIQTETNVLAAHTARHKAKAKRHTRKNASRNKKP